MTVTPRKYNPGFLSDDELVASFCVRTEEFVSMMEGLRESSGDSNTHQIVIGPRGSGKTSLLLRVAAEIRRDAELAARFFPVVFAEESYEVSTAGEFWLEALSRLADQAPNGDDRPDLRRTFEELRQIRDDRTLGDRCLGALQDFADREGKRFVLMVENLNMLFRDVADPETGWRLRQTLQTEPRILLLASATSRFDEMDDRKLAFYELFRVFTLGRLSQDECAVLWSSVSGRQRPPETVEPLRILTGGSPRLLAIVARFGARLSLRELMADLLDLVDDHTEYFKSHLDALPAQERRVYLALADLWIPATAREIADRARLETSKCSAHLARLVERGAVEVTGGSARRKLYYLGERLYNIYYLMRRARGPAATIEALIRFMEGWYSVDEWKEIGVRTARDASALDGELLEVCRTGFERLLQLPSLEAHREELLSLARATFADWPDDLSITTAPPSLAKELVHKALALAKEGRLQESVDAWDEVVDHLEANEARPDRERVALALLHKGMVLDQLQQPHEALAAYEEVLEGFQTGEVTPFPQWVATALVGKGFLLGRIGRREEALAAYDAVLERFGSSDMLDLREAVSTALLGKAAGLIRLGRPEQALESCDEILERNGTGGTPKLRGAMAYALVIKGTLLFALNRQNEASSVYEAVVQRFREAVSPTLHTATAMLLCARATFELLGVRPAAAIDSINQVLDRESSIVPEIGWQAHMIRARAHLFEGDVAACEQDVAAALAILPTLGALSRVALDGLVGMAVELGLEKTRHLIRVSPAADLLLPLTTALEMELGEEPRVAKEVEEVAEDILRDLAERRNARQG